MFFSVGQFDLSGKSLRIKERHVARFFLRLAEMSHFYSMQVQGLPSRDSFHNVLASFADHAGLGKLQPFSPQSSEVQACQLCSVSLAPNAKDRDLQKWVH